MEPTMQILCKNCGKEESIERSVLKTKQTHICTGCGQEMDLGPIQKAANAFDKRYGLVHRDDPEK
jgi:hypothetical protein